MFDWEKRIPAGFWIEMERNKAESAKGDSTKGSFSTPNFKNFAAGEAPLLRDAVFLDCSVVQGVVNRRWGLLLHASSRRTGLLQAADARAGAPCDWARHAGLFPHSVAIYRKEGDRTPCSVWPMRGCSVGQLFERDCLVKTKRIPLFLGLAADKFKHRKLVRPHTPLCTVCRAPLPR